MRLYSEKNSGHSLPEAIFILMCMYAWSVMSDSLQSHSPPGFSVHGIFQARILEWVAIFSSRGSSQSRDRNHVSGVSYIGRQILYHHTTWDSHQNSSVSYSIQHYGLKVRKLYFSKSPLYKSSWRGGIFAKVTEWNHNCLYLYYLVWKRNSYQSDQISWHIMSVCGRELKCIKEKWNDADNMCFASNWVLIWTWL